ncbi:MAG: amidohydrolase family protein [bacterium]
MKKIDVHAHHGKLFVANNVPPTAEALLAYMDKWEIELCVLSHTLGIFLDMVEGNRATRKLVEESDRIRGYIYFDPTKVKASIEEIERYSEVPGFVGVKTRADYHGENIDSRNSREILKVVERHRLPMLLHTFSKPIIQGACEVGKDFNIPIILAHMGGEFWRECVESARDIPNLYFDPCSSYPLADKIKETVDAVGAGRVVFGSDITLLSPGWTIGMIESADLTESERRMIYYENAKEIFDFTDIIS